MEKLKSTKLLGIIGAIVTIIGLFLPFATVTAKAFGIKHSESITYIQADGLYVLLLAVITLLMIFSDKLSEKVAFFRKISNMKLVLVPTVLAAIILIFDMINAADVVGDVSTSLVSAEISYGIGLWVLWIGLIATAIFPFIYKKDETTTSVKTTSDEPIETKE